MKYFTNYIFFLIFTLGFNTILYGQWQHMNGSATNRINGFARADTCIFAASESNGVFLSTDSGANWAPTNNGLINHTIFSITACGNNVYAGTDGSGVYQSVDFGSNWSNISYDMTYPQVMALTNNGHDVIAAAYYGGAFRYTFGDTTWTPIYGGLTNYYPHCLDAKDTSLIMGTAHGIFVSFNNGNNWIPVTNGLGASNISQAIWFNGNIIATIPINGGVIMSSDSGNSWVAMNNGLANLDAYSLASNDSIILVGTSSGGLFMSVDSAQSWTSVNGGLPPDFIMSLKIIDDYVLAGTAAGGIWKRSLTDFILSAGNQPQKLNISIYPNPTKDKLFVSVDGPTTKALKFTVADVLGNLIYSSTIESIRLNEIEMNDFKDGIYFINLTDGFNTFNQKFILIHD